MNDKEETGRQGERDVKRCLTEMRNKDGGSEEEVGGGGDVIIDSRRSQTNFHP